MHNYSGSLIYWHSFTSLSWLVSCFPYMLSSYGFLYLSKGWDHHILHKIPDQAHNLFFFLMLILYIPFCALASKILSLFFSFLLFSFFVDLGLMSVTILVGFEGKKQNYMFCTFCPLSHRLNLLIRLDILGLSRIAQASKVI